MSIILLQAGVPTCSSATAMFLGWGQFVAQFDLVQRSLLMISGWSRGPSCLYIARPFNARQAIKITYMLRNAIHIDLSKEPSTIALTQRVVLRKGQRQFAE